MLRPSKWHPKVGEEFWSAEVEIKDGMLNPTVSKHIFGLTFPEILPKVVFDNCYKTGVQAMRQAEIMVYELYKEMKLPVPQWVRDKYQGQY